MHAPPPARRVWLTVGLLFLATVLNYLDRQTLAVAAPVIRAEMGLSLRQVGTLLSAFLWSYALFQVLAGVLVDRVSVKWAYAAAVAGWSLAGAAGGLATGFTSLLAFRLLLGVFESANWPAALRVVSRTVPPAQRTLANGIFQSGTSVGALVAPRLMVWLIEKHSWRGGFVVVGLAGLTWVALWLAVFRDAPAAAPDTAPDIAGAAAGAADDAPGTLGAIVRSPIFWSLFVASAFLNPAQYFYMNWLPTYYTVSLGQAFGRALADQLTAAYFLYDVGLLSGGVAVVRLARRAPVHRARLRVAACGVPLMAAVLLAPRLAEVTLVTAAIGTAMFGLGLVMANYLAFAIDVSHARVSTVYGLLGAAGSVSGAAFTQLVGVLADAGGFALPVLMVGLMPVVTLAGIWNCVRLISRRDRARAPALTPAAVAG